jgi:hypothetical protein
MTTQTSGEQSRVLVDVGGPEMVRVGSARSRVPDSGRHRGLYIVSAVTERGRRIDIDSSACPFLCQGVIEAINRPEAGR